MNAPLTFRGREITCACGQCSAVRAEWAQGRTISYGLSLTGMVHAVYAAEARRDRPADGWHLNHAQRCGMPRNGIAYLSAITDANYAQLYRDVRHCRRCFPDGVPA